ncbi:MAG TPA: amidohydrolase family protein [Chloroflexota bacterium]|nr:amidohydrolase family protein [Chloroflexota bacterium]
MAAVIDADTHLLESDEMWQHLDADMYARRPVKVRVPNDTLYGKSNVFWLIDGNIFPRPAGRGGMLLATPTDQESIAGRPDVKARELVDLEWRLKDMQAMGVDVQVVYPTLFLTYLTDDVRLEIALCKAYNRFLADVWARQPRHIRWVLMPPLRSIEATIDELRYGKEHGAVGIFFRGIEKDRTLDDPYFFPVYEEASRLDLPICIHTGSGCPEFTKLIDVSRSSAFPHGRLLPLISIRNIITNKIPEQFPKLRFACVETGASWVPYILHNIRNKTEIATEQWGARLFDDYRIFIACEEREDIGYLVKYVGEDHLFTGTDYAHHATGAAFGGDPSAQPEMVRNLRAREDVAPGVIDKILSDNPRRLYGL